MRAERTGPCWYSDEVILKPPPVDWECPHCTATDRTEWNTPNRFHACGGLGGLTAPLVKSGSRSHVIIVEREDYIAGDTPATVSGRPVTGVRVARPDGSYDMTVYAPAVGGQARMMSHGMER